MRELEKDYHCLNCFGEFNSADVCDSYLIRGDIRRISEMEFVEFQFLPSCPKCQSRKVESITHAGESSVEFDEDGLLKSFSFSFRCVSIVSYIQYEIGLN